MNTYLHSIRYGFIAEGLLVDFSDHSLLDKGEDRLMHVVNNRFAEQQAKGMIIKPHNTISADDV